MKFCNTLTFNVRFNELNIIENKNSFSYKISKVFYSFKPLKNFLYYRPFDTRYFILWFVVWSFLTIYSRNKIFYTYINNLDEKNIFNEKYWQSNVRVSIFIPKFQPPILTAQFSIHYWCPSPRPPNPLNHATTSIKIPRENQVFDAENLKNSPR